MIYIDICECKANHALQHDKAYDMLFSLLTNLGYENFSFSKEDSGRPFVNIKGVDISVSHSKNAVAVAVSTKRDTDVPCTLCLPVTAARIGLDVEAHSDKLDLAAQNKLSERFLASSVSSKNEFYRLWTRNEAYGKMTGEGVICKKTEKCEYLSFEIAFCDDIYSLSLSYK